MRQDAPQGTTYRVAIARGDEKLGRLTGGRRVTLFAVEKARPAMWHTVPTTDAGDVDGFRRDLVEDLNDAVAWRQRADDAGRPTAAVRVTLFATTYPDGRPRSREVAQWSVHEDGAAVTQAATAAGTVDPAARLALELVAELLRAWDLATVGRA